MECTDGFNPTKVCVPHKIFAKFGPHECKIVCIFCLRFMGWGPAKENEDKRAQRLNVLETLQKGELTEWEASFIKSIKSQNNLSPKQTAVYEKIRDKYLSMPAPTPLSATVTATYTELDNLF